MRRALPIAIAAFIAAFFTAGSLRAQSLNPSLETERRVLAPAKVAYLFNMAKFVAWPGPDSNIDLCISNESPLWPHAQELDGRDLGDGRRLRTYALAGAISCDIVFADMLVLDQAESTVLGGGDDILLVSDARSALDAGFAVEIYFEAGRLRFDFNEDAIRASNYQVSAKLLRLARPRGSPDQ